MRKVRRLDFGFEWQCRMLYVRMLRLWKSGKGLERRFAG